MSYIRNPLAACVSISGIILSLAACNPSQNSPSAEKVDQNEFSSQQSPTEFPSAQGLPEVPLEQRVAVDNAKFLNREATIPPQCYTQTTGKFNPCYVCHQNYDRSAVDRLNRMEDGFLQGDYNFSDVGLTNHWENLFIDKEAWLEQISDSDIQNYVNTDNYSGLVAHLKTKDWSGFIPDLQNYQSGAAAFDEQGLALDGSHWVAFNYKPFPGTFWPTNGATDDVIIRLPKAFRELAGKFNRDVYFVNLSLIELNIKQLNEISIWPINETAVDIDLDGNGVLETANSIVPRTQFIGDAQDIAIEFQQFPQGTQFMHSVRYVGVSEEKGIHVPKRMKELRYMEKMSVLNRNDLNGRYDRERKEKFLGELPSFINRQENGLDNGMGWFVRGFIEDYDGSLRPQTFEEQVFCMGCHSAIGTTIDNTFAFARKVTGAKGWGYINLVNMIDAPSITESEGEILNYLRRAGGGNEFRQNAEMMEKWFNSDGSLKQDEVTSADVYSLITPSTRRALDLNKAYTYLVRHQSYILGRDATVNVPENVFRVIDEEVPPLEAQHRFFEWDIRLNWPIQNNAIQ